MYTYWISVAVIIVIGIIIAIIRKEWLDFIIGILIGVFGSIVITIFVSMILGNTSSYYEQTQDIVSLKDDSYIYGSFILGCGNIGDNDTYTFYTKTTDGGFVKKSINTSSVILYEDQTDTTAYIKYKYTIHNAKYPNYQWVIFTGCYKQLSGIELHVPKNTIYKHFEVK